jgi:hypothetical protein
MFKSGNFRTIFLALFATASFVGSAIYIFDIEPKLMLGFFVAAVLCLVILVVAAFIFSTLRALIKRRF